MLTEFKEYINNSPEVQTTINWWDLYSGHRLILEKQFQRQIFSEGVKKSGSFSKLANKLSIQYVNRKTISGCYNLSIKPTIRLIISILNLLEIPLSKATSKIKQISNLRNPKLPFNLNTIAGADIRAAFLSDGHVPMNSIKPPIYCAFERELHLSLIESCRKVFGEFNTNICKGNKSLQTRFPSVIGKALELAGVPRGNKQLVSCFVPKDIIVSSNAIKSAYLRRVFDDEGDVYFKEKSKRAVRMSRSSIYKQNFLLAGEKLLLISLGIKPNIYYENTYTSKKDIITFKQRIQIARQAELRKFNQIVGFSLIKKATKLKVALDSYERIK